MGVKESKSLIACSVGVTSRSIEFGFCEGGGVCKRKRRLRVKEK
jgi:hypothetical protein